MDLGWIIGRAKTSFVHAKEPITLSTKSGKSRSLLEICEASTPPCNLNPLLFNGHLQTFMTVVKGVDVPIYYKRKVFEAEDPVYAGTYTVDFVVSPYEGSEEGLFPRTTHYTEEEFKDIGSLDSKPMLVALHGLSGGSHEIYLRHCLAPLIEGETGWEACVVNSRGCAGSNITTPVLFNARATWDVRQTIKWLRKTFPNRPLFGIGFSLGANILTNYCGEEGTNCELKAAVVCSNPWNLDVSSKALRRTWIGLEVYSKVMNQNLQRLFDRHIDVLTQNPRINVEEVKSAKYLWEFDKYVQRQAWGYPTEDAYYRDASSCDSLLAIRIPFFAINAKDDPIAHEEAIPYSEFEVTPYAVLCATSLGGHLSWFETGGSRWFSKPACNFLKTMATEIDHEKPIQTHWELAATNTNSKLPLLPTFDPMRRKMHNQAR